MQKIYIYKEMGYIKECIYDLWTPDEENIFLSLHNCLEYICKNNKKGDSYRIKNFILCGLIDDTGIKVIYYVNLDGCIICRDKKCWDREFINTLSTDFEIDIDTTEDEQLLQVFKMMK